MKKISCLTFALTAGIVASLTTGIEAANAGPAKTFLIPFTGVVYNTCYMQPAISSPAVYEASMCETHQELSSATETIQVSRDSTEAIRSVQESSSAISQENITTIQFTTVVR